MGYLSRTEYLNSLTYDQRREMYVGILNESGTLEEQLCAAYYQRLFQEAKLTFLEISQATLQSFQADTSMNIKEVLAEHQQNLYKKSEEHILSYQDYLTQRDYVEAISPGDMQKDMTALSETFFLNAVDFSENIASSLARVTSALEQAERKLLYMFDEISKKGMAREDLRQSWSDYAHAAQTKLAENSSEDFLALCETGNLAGLKRQLKSSFFGSSKKIVNQEGTAVHDDSVQVSIRGLHLACLHGHPDVVVYLLNCGADPTLPDSGGYLPLNHAVLDPQNKNSAIVIKILLSQKLELILDLPGAYGRTALHTAALVGNTDAVRTLLQHGADANLQEDAIGKFTPLHNAVERKQLDVITLLTLHQQKVRVGNANDESPLLQAVVTCNKEVINHFMALGVNLTAEELQRLDKGIAQRRYPEQARDELASVFDDFATKIRAMRVRHPAAELAAWMQQGLNPALPQRENAQDDVPGRVALM